MPSPNTAAPVEVGRWMVVLLGFLTLAFAFSVRGSLSLVMLTVGGIRYVTAGGDKDGVNGAKQTVKHALLGLAVAILAPVLIQIIKTILGQ